MNLTFLLQGPMGIAGPILLIMLVLWMARGDRDFSPCHRQFWLANLKYFGDWYSF